MLLNYGAQVNTQGAIPPLTGAVLSGQTEAVKLMLECGAQVKCGTLLLMATLWHGGKVKFVLHSCLSHMRECNKVPTSLIEFVEDMSNSLPEFVKFSDKEYYEILKLLLDYGAEGNNTLLAASMIGHTKTVEILLDYGTEVNYVQNDGISALMGASLEGHSVVVKLLLDHGAQVNMLDSKGNSALSFASLMGDIQIPFLTDDGRYSALWRGSKEEYIETARVLLNRGAEVDQKNDKEVSAQLVACSTGNIEMLKLLISHGCQIDPKGVEIAHQRNHIETVELLNMIRKHAESSKLGTSYLLQEIQKIKEQGKEMEAKLEGKLDGMHKILEKVIAANAICLNTTASQLISLRPSKTLKELMTLASKWRTIGILLDLQPEELDTIAANNNQVQECLRNMLEEWHKMTDPPPSWERLVEAVKVVHPKRAKEIHDKYCTLQHAASESKFSCH